MVPGVGRIGRCWSEAPLSLLSQGLLSVLRGWRWRNLRKRITGTKMKVMEPMGSHGKSDVFENSRNMRENICFFLYKYNLSFLSFHDSCPIH